MTICVPPLSESAQGQEVGGRIDHIIINIWSSQTKIIYSHCSVNIEKQEDSHFDTGHYRIYSGSLSITNYVDNNGDYVCLCGELCLSNDIVLG